MMRLLVANPLWPHPGHTVRSANVVIFSLLRALARTAEVDLGFVKLTRSARAGDEPTPEEREGIGALRSEGVDVLEPLVVPDPPPAAAWRWLRWRERIYPEIRHQGAASHVVEAFGADVVLVPWSEWGTVLFARAPAVRFAYYGNPDPKVLRARAAFDRAHGGAFLPYARRRAVGVLVERAHLDVMRCYHLLGNVAANDAAYYVRHGHPNAFYVRNTWLDRLGPAWEEQRERLETVEPLRIIGSVGKLSGIANNHGLEILVRALLPRLRRRLGSDRFEIHVLGAGRPHPAVGRLLRESAETVVRGFVDDIDAEILRSPVFLCVNNASPYKVGHTRYLHAWSLGACIVAHRDAALSMPEMVHQHNALLGADMEEIAALLERAVRDEALRRRLGRTGYRTYRSLFTPEQVVRSLLDRIRIGAGRLPGLTAR